MPGKRTAKLGTRVVAGLVGVSLVLTGCVTATGLRNKYTVAGDVCQAYREPIFQSQEHFNEKIVESAVVGALIGAGAGLLFGGKKRGEAAVIGGLAGLTAGLGAGYLRAKAARAKSRQELIGSINSDITRDNYRMTALGKSLRQLNDCRQDQLDRLADDLQAGLIDKATGKTKLEAIRTAIRNDNSLVQEIFGKVDERGTAYVDASAVARDVNKDTMLGAAGRYEPTLWTPPPAQTESQPKTETADTGLFVALKNSNVRRAPSVRSDVLGLIPKGKTVTVIADGSQPADWYRVRFSGKDGFVYRTLLKGPEVAVQAEEQPTKPDAPTRRPKVTEADLPTNAPPVQHYVTKQAELKAQQESDFAFLEEKAETIDVLLAV